MLKTLSNCSCFVACLILSGCTPLTKASLDTFKSTLSSAEPLHLTKADVDAVPYAQIKVTTPSNEGVMAKLRQEGDLQYWVASGKQVLLMRNGLVVRSVGLDMENDLDGTRFDGESPFKRGLQHVAEGETSTRTIDIYQREGTQLVVNSRYSRKGLETVTIIDQPYVLQRIDETLEIPALGFSGTNRFWVRPDDGLILQSEQYLTPELFLNIVHLRPDWESAR